MSIRVSLIVAVAQNGVIGKDNQLPWHLPADLKHFKSVTMGKPIIMGRNTYESIGRPLPGRTNIVVSSTMPELEDAPVRVARNMDQALEVAREQALLDGVEEVLVIGGAELYRQSLKQVERIYRTLVEVDAEGDAFFELSYSDWKLVAERVVTDANITCRFQVLEKQ